MGAPITKTVSWHHSDIDMIIDVRAPSEYLDDHIPGAVNLPVLSDSERSEIGTLYKQVSPYEARKKGAALVSQNIANHLQTTLQDKPPHFKPLIHCWRGGQRSQSFALICAEIGWPSYLLDGGYKAYRSAIITSLTTKFEPFQIRLIGGPTGSAKTKLLHQIERLGGQILDLEALANHRGSLLGADPRHEQPSQRLFETRLIDAMSHLDPNLPVYIEAESAKIGKVQIPQMLWQKMCTAPAVSLSIPIESRVAFLLEDYNHLFGQPDTFLKLIDGMQNRHSRDIRRGWQEALQAKDWPQLANLLLEQHYDPSYHRSASRHNRPYIWDYAVPDCEEHSLHEAAKALLNNTAWIAGNE